ncbi:Response regulator of zinc sigma-54-dependent two-component system [Klebsiella pneumoniae]|uniref:Chemotaxis protein CheY n=1 Tax=Klebsiella pneumoniae TaxID=573 RepID=A0A377ZQC3_KLEPN|nr:Response regulator of zinc sigma-54-dependent two-component system [Klebsiella pneumoniae]
MSSDKVQILVVDDDISHCTILQALLRGWGYQVGLAHNGLQALEQIHQQVFDLVLCDIRMAEMDGIATLKEIKAYNPAIPGADHDGRFPSVGTAVEAIKSGALDYLVKPLDFDHPAADAGSGIGAHPAERERPQRCDGFTVGHDWRQPGDAGAS